MRKILCFWFCCSWAMAQPQKFTFQSPKMGATFTIHVYATNTKSAARAADRAFAAVDSLNLIFSDYLATSELSQLSQTAGTGNEVLLSPALFDILQQSKVAYQKSKGAFDISVGTLTQLWRKSRKTKQLPDSITLQKALQTVGFGNVKLNNKQKTCALLQPGTLLDLGGIGKGYAAQVMLKIMQEAGFRQVLCDAAGNMAIGEAPPNRQGWSVGVQLPDAHNKLLDKFLMLKNIAVSTSGDVYQFVEIEGVRYSHIVNPKTGLGLTNQRQVTVVAKHAAQADWLSTACCILPIEQALRLVKKEKATALILEQKNGEIITWKSKDWAD